MATQYPKIQRYSLTATYKIVWLENGQTRHDVYTGELVVDQIGVLSIFQHDEPIQLIRVFGPGVWQQAIKVSS